MYPLILSIENHCSVEYQDKMADHLVDILGEILFTDEVNESRNALPSPPRTQRSGEIGVS